MTAQHYADLSATQALCAGEPNRYHWTLSRSVVTCPECIHLLRVQDAAPQLLEALEGMLRREDDPRLVVSAIEDQAIIDSARSAIAAARGGT